MMMNRIICAILDGLRPHRLTNTPHVHWPMQQGTVSDSMRVATPRGLLAARYDTVLNCAAQRPLSRVAVRTIIPRATACDCVRLRATACDCVRTHHAASRGGAMTACRSTPVHTDPRAGQPWRQAWCASGVARRAGRGCRATGVARAALSTAACSRAAKLALPLCVALGVGLDRRLGGGEGGGEVVG